MSRAEPASPPAPPSARERYCQPPPSNRASERASSPFERQRLQLFPFLPAAEQHPNPCVLGGRVPDPSPPPKFVCLSRAGHQQPLPSPCPARPPPPPPPFCPVHPPTHRETPIEAKMPCCALAACLDMCEERLRGPYPPPLPPRCPPFISTVHGVPAAPRRSIHLSPSSLNRPLWSPRLSRRRAITFSCMQRPLSFKYTFCLVGAGQGREGGQESA